MVEVVIPFPSANYLNLVSHNSVKGESLPPAPEPPALSPSDFEGWAEDWGNIALQYDINIPAPPEQKTTVSVSIHGTPDSKDEWRFCHTEKIKVPAGYQTYRGSVKISKNNAEDNWWVTAYLGNYFLGRSHDGDSGSYPTRDMTNLRGELTFAVNAQNCRSLTVTGQIYCEVTDERMKEWAAEAYDAALQGYRTQLSVWENAVNAIKEETKQLIEAQKHNRRINAEKVIREEIQRAFLCLLLKKNIHGFDPFYADAENSRVNYDFDKVEKIGSQIQFLQQVFEWRNMNIVFYPYFWGPEKQWISMVLETDQSDAVFFEFLASGSARVQAPIRPEKVIEAFRYLNLGPIPKYSGTISEAGEVDILQEILENSDHPDDAEPIGEPWEMTLPTSLVILQGMDEVKLRDSLRLNDSVNNEPGDEGYSVLEVNPSIKQIAEKGNAVSEKRLNPVGSLQTELV